MSLTPIEQLIAFVDVERKHYPNKKHVAEWALAKLYEQADTIAKLKKECYRLNGECSLLALERNEADNIIAQQKEQLNRWVHNDISREQEIIELRDQLSAAQ